MKPNASLITFLTVPAACCEKIAFLYLKELEEMTPWATYWYRDKGKFGVARKSLSKFDIYQWLAVGEDNEIRAVWDNLKKNNKVEINYKNKKGEIVQKTFIISGALKEATINDEQNINIIQGVKPCEGSFRRQYFTVQNWGKEIGNSVKYLLEESTLSYLEGYGITNKNKIKPIYPPGLFEKGILYKMFKNSIIAVVEERGIIYGFKGISEDKNGKKEDPKIFIGFIQDDPDARRNYKIRISDMNDSMSRETEVDEKTGRWKLDLGYPISKGKFLLLNKQNNFTICGEKFYLIKDIIIEPHIITQEVTDLYQRKISVTRGEQIRRADEPQGFVWVKKSFPEAEKAEIELSDRLSRIFIYLAPKILIQDPFLLGETEVENDLPKLKSRGQIVFINSLLTASAKTNITELWLLGHKSKIKQPTTQIIDNYKKIFDGFKQIVPKKVIIKFGTMPFHDRYWVGRREKEEDIVYRVSNSISGLAESEELSVERLDRFDRIKMAGEILERWNTSGDELIVYERNT
jgi:hypothetical protein